MNTFIHVEILARCRLHEHHCLNVGAMYCSWRAAFSCMSLSYAYESAPPNPNDGTHNRNAHVLRELNLRSYVLLHF